MGEQQDLEQLAHLAGAFAGQALHREADFVLRRRVLVAAERLRPLDDAEAAQEIPLVHQAVDIDAAGGGGTAQPVEIHMAGEIGLARMGKRRVEFMVAHGLQRVAIGGDGIAVVNNHGGAADFLQPGADRAHHRLTGRRDLENRAVRQAGGCGRQKRRIDAGDAERVGQLVIGIETDHALAKPGRCLDELAEGNSVEQLVGGEQDEAARHLVEGIVPVDLPDMCGQRLALEVAQLRAGLDHMHAHSGIEIGGKAGDDAQHVGHHRAASRPDLDKADIARRPMPLPGMDHEHADHLAEELADFRRGDEIAALSEGLATAVIAVFGVGEAKREVIRHADRSMRADQGLDGVAELCRHAVMLPLSGPPGAQRNRDADENHRHRQDHAHGEPAAGEIAKLRIRLAEEFHGDARHRIPGDEDAADHAGMFQRTGEADQEVEDDRHWGRSPPRAWRTAGPRARH